MSFWQKVKYSLAKFMQGRHGADALTKATILTGLLFTLLGSIFSASIVGTILAAIGMALYIWTIFRMFSRNSTARWKENAKYTALMGQVKLGWKHFFARLKNMKEYKYFRCPACKASLRLKRGAGEGTLTCGKCGHKFKVKA